MRAADLIAHPHNWIREMLYDNPDNRGCSMFEATQFCALGAIWRAYHGIYWDHKLNDSLLVAREVMHELHPELKHLDDLHGWDSALVYFNNHKDTTHEQILEVVRAIDTRLEEKACSQAS